MFLVPFLYRAALLLLLTGVPFLDGGAQGRGRGQGGGPGAGMGMPEAERENIHGLFEAHDKIKRKVKVTKNGYVSTTTSEDPEVVKMLQSHVGQMKKRLDSGLRVRRWDPAFDEYVAHYKDIAISIKSIKNGLRVTAMGKTDDAVKVARNHAAVISAFVENGWDEHHAEHPAALTPKKDPKNAEDTKEEAQAAQP